MKRRSVLSRRAAVVPCAALAAVLLVSSCTQGAVATGSVGAGGVGDPLFPSLGNGGYDVSHYGLELAYDVAEGRLDATARITAKATRDLRAFRLDLQGLRVTSVRVDGATAGFSRKGHKLTVRPAEGLRKGSTFRATVAYDGAPQEMTDADGASEGWVKTRDGAFVSGEPAGAMTWFPGNNHPSDKAAYDIRITVPRGYTAVAGGELRSSVTSGGRTTFVWHSGEPMATYLATATIGRFDVHQSRTADGLPLYVAVNPKEAAGSRKALDRLPEVLAWSRKLFGPYPFTSAGAIVDHTPERIDWVALETQTKPVYAGAPDTSTVVHETAHQWFGDSVTPRTWADTWLNEGFAQYAEWLWEAHEGGRTPQERFDALYALEDDDEDEVDGVTYEELWEFPPGDPGSAENVTGTPVYDRGAMVLQQLRKAVGDQAFYRILREWPAAHRHGNADSEEFIDFCQERTDVDLTDLFDDWLYGEGRPDWEY
ncbi:M1 family metallopeptidase [Streptomyces catenulae]|uniref:Aminopeptidase N n=1 Tax=Streptomyces catenulae TaxID=66875 RepID=A0ABV2Z7R6_9ACTN|nr:M1 family metallopeptidase [Streptomyces catenulae]